MQSIPQYAPLLPLPAQFQQQQQQQPQSPRSFQEQMNTQYVLHQGHSSVMVLATGQCLEIRRGSQRYGNIYGQFIWNTVDEWYAAVPYIRSDMAERPFPPNFNHEQAWMQQWHEQSTLLHGTRGQLECVDPARIQFVDAITGNMIPLYMNIENGLMYAEGLAFSSFTHTRYSVSEIWRYEMGVYYRIQ